MNRLILASYKDTRNNKQYKELFINDFEYKSTFNNFNDLNFENVEIIPLVIKGSSYNEKQAAAQKLAIEYSLFRCQDADIDLSIMEYSTIADYFEKIGKRFGLIQEFRENAIC